MFGKIRITRALLTPVKKSFDGAKDSESRVRRPRISRTSEAKGGGLRYDAVGFTDRQHQGIDRCASRASFDVVSASPATQNSDFTKALSIYRTKCRPEFRAGGFQNPDVARPRVAPFVHGCHGEHGQSAIGN